MLKIIQTIQPKTYFIFLFNNQYRGFQRVAYFQEEKGSPKEAPVVAETGEANQQETSVGRC